MQQKSDGQHKEIPDVCYIAEGTYPYITGGVSSWSHDLIKTQPHLTFHIVCILAPDANPVVRFDLPPNVVGITNIFLQKLPEKGKKLPKKEREELFTALEMPLLKMQHKPSLKELRKILELFEKNRGSMSRDLLLNSKEAWNTIIRMYNSTMGETSFNDYFWSWRGLFSGLFSILLAEVPKARIYHSSCTGYSGLYIAKCFLESNSPCMVTEHGIYTNERMIQLTASDWLHELSFVNFTVDKKSYHRDLKDLWMDLFSGYSFLAYQACMKILTLFEGNVALQIADGADPKKIEIIPNGVDIKRYENVKREEGRPPTAALIGRAVPIKDVKTFIKAAAIVRDAIPEAQCWLLGPTDEDPSYYSECLQLVEKYQLEKNFTFVGKVDIAQYLGKIDIMVLTSISEAQPLTILEAGAAAIPFVSTNVGCCSEYAWGRSDEIPNIGEGGIITPLANPRKVAEGILRFMREKDYYQSCGKNLNERIHRFYSYDKFVNNYKKCYEEMLALSRDSSPPKKRCVQ